MTILTIRTDKPDSEIGIYDDAQQVDYCVWQAHRQLAETINIKIKELLDNNKLSLEDLEGIVVYKGPGSFTGLRIGLTVANAFAAALQIPIVSDKDNDWQTAGTKKLLDGQNEQISIPEYGSPPHITSPKH